MIRADVAAARSLDKMATEATDVAQDRHAHGHRHRREHTRDRERHGQTQRDRETEKETREGRDGLIPKKIPPKKLVHKNRGSLGFRV
jgi:Ni/Co efflux regulator RcnB